MPHDQIYDKNGQIGPCITYYGCTKCQTYHYGDEAIFEDHIHFQSKHGTARMHVERRIDMLVNPPGGKAG